MKSMEIVIVSGGMPTGPNTLEVKSLGGSETAALCLAKALKARGHLVALFCNIPPEGEPDHIEPGAIGFDGVRYVPLEQYGQFITSTEVDLLIASRAPDMLMLNHQARKAVLWCHDLATYEGPAKNLPAVAWNIDEIWCVSEFHAEQYSKLTGYPREFVKVLCNAVPEIPTIDLGPPEPRSLVYAARPERGLMALVRPGGIMSQLPEYNLKICMYANYPESMKPLYDQLFTYAHMLPNVQVMGSLTQPQLRQLIRDSWAYVYPTEFEETSCILAQEVLEQNRLFITCREGALPETLGQLGIFYTGNNRWNTDEFCKEFSDLIREVYHNPEGHALLATTYEPRYWSAAAEDVEKMGDPIKPEIFSQVWSLMEDSDIIPAIALIKSETESGGLNEHTIHLKNSIEELYPYLFGKESFAGYYERYFIREDSKGARHRRSMAGEARYQAIEQQIGELPDGSVILDYGCAEGVIILDLAKKFPGKVFHGVDFAQSNVDLCKKYAEEMELKNVTFKMGDSAEIDGIIGPYMCDAVICSEVLEHVLEPWSLLMTLESRVKAGGRVITTVPMGPWEALGLYNKEQHPWRAHIWYINKWMMRHMVADKTNCRMASIPNGSGRDGRCLGHLLCSYEADHKPVNAVNALEKAQRSRFRETITACIIANNCDTLGRTLKSLDVNVQAIHVSILSKDEEVQSEIIRVMDVHQRSCPWHICKYSIDPPIEVLVNGFDDARNRSVAQVETDWVLWIDTDEYLSGHLAKYLRPSAFDAYALSQHHFTVDPRGAPAQIDKPARVYRANRGFKFFGKVHEHAEKGANQGPGFCTVLPDVDIGHIGYVNEDVRRGRFTRNFPLLEWDHKTNPQRSLGKFLWLRDIIHRMRYAAAQGDVAFARHLAQEAIQYYRDEWKEGNILGMGGETALSYYSEAMAFLGIGVHLQFSYKILDQDVTLSGVFQDVKEAVSLFERSISGQFDKQLSRYWG